MLALPQVPRVESSTLPLFILINGTIILGELPIVCVALRKSLTSLRLDFFLCII